MSSAAINYERLVAEFKDGLLHTLRGHAASEAYLELWVPDVQTLDALMREIRKIRGVLSVDRVRV